MKNLLIPALSMLLITTACNKGFNDVHGVTNIPRSMVFTVSSPTLININIIVLRKAGDGFIPVESFHADNAATPYTLSSTKTESGDAVSIIVTNTVTKPTTASLKIADKYIPVMNEGVKSSPQATAPDQYYQLWSAIIP